MEWVMGLLSRSAKPPVGPPNLRPPRSMWWWALPAALLIGAAAWGTTAWLLQDVDKLPIAEQISTRIEAARTALAAAAGVGAAVTLLLAVRRQRHQELATAHTTHDAAERRVTELYTKAVEQLGNDQAPVRLGGLYALERLGEHTPALQQTIVDVMGAYLRMPYAPPSENAAPADPAVPRAAVAGVSAPVAGRDPQEEREVRLTALRILTAHLRYEPAPSRRWWRPRPADLNPRHWPDIRLDLTGAVLFDFDFDRCRVGDARFTRATFIGDARLEGATFTGSAHFDKVTFADGVWFEESAFTGWTTFSDATFTTNAWFEAVTFDRDAQFADATFGSIGASFGRAIFNGDAGFGRATFAGDALFGKATFTNRAWFDKVTFGRDAWFEEAMFLGGASFGKVTFAGDAGFKGATGLEAADLRDVRVTPAAEDMERWWPAGWREEPEPGADEWQTLRLAAADAARAGEDGADAGARAGA
ncbi:pentapeptide repeat-containing protein [Nonomuraea polychroma]|uniref:pentapeptide repeat-containing protein n=1 Tax=Nonomuraea polychroma TaxID=46176 RepID=UPI003D939F3D